MGNQSGVIFGYLAVAFLIYITLKGELPVYAGLLLLSPQQPKGSSGDQTSNLLDENSSTLIQGAISAAAFV